MGGVYVDRSYRTMLGTAFYDRLGELARLEAFTGSRRVVIVYGPRNVGKSELARYFIRRRYSVGFVVTVDSRLLQARELEERVKAFSVVSGSRSGLAGGLVEGLVELLSSRFGVVDLLLWVKRVVGGVVPRIGETLLFVDELHELPGYAGLSYEYVLGELRSLAALLSKSNHHLKVIVTIGEGFAASPRALSLLEGYSTEWLLVEPMDKAHFNALLTEYRRGTGAISAPMRYMLSWEVLREPSPISAPSPGTRWWSVGSRRGSRY